MKYQIIALIILALQFVVIIWDGIKNKSRLRHRWSGISKLVFMLMGPFDIVAVIYGHSMLGYSYKIPGMIMAIVGLLFVYIFLIDRNRKGGPKRILNKISRNPMYFGLILIYIGIMLMFFNWILIIWTAFTIIIIRIQIADEEQKMMQAVPHAYKVYKRRVFRFFGIKTWWFILGLIIIIAAGIVFSRYYSAQRIVKISKMNFKSAVEYYTEGNSDVVLTVGTIQDGNLEYNVYGKNGSKLKHEAHTYELASASKIMTAALVNKAVAEGKLDINAEIGEYLDFPEQNFYPSIKELLTHTSGYKSFYFESPMIVNGLIDINTYHGIKSKMVINRIRDKSLPLEVYDFKYSNYGYALLGAILEKVYDEDYKTLINQYTKELGLDNTGFNNTDKDLGNYTQWSDNDIYGASNGINSDIEDMLKFINTMINDQAYSNMYQSLRVIGEDINVNKTYNIFSDEIGMAWIIDNTNGYVWTTGGSDGYNMYIGFSPSTKKAVIVMSNMPKNYRMSTTVMGIKLLRNMTVSQSK